MIPKQHPCFKTTTRKAGFFQRQSAIDRTCHFQDSAGEFWRSFRLNAAGRFKEDQIARFVFTGMGSGQLKRGWVLPPPEVLAKFWQAECGIPVGASTIFRAFERLNEVGLCETNGSKGYGVYGLSFPIRLPGDFEARIKQHNARGIPVNCGGDFPLRTQFYLLLKYALIHRLIPTHTAMVSANTIHESTILDRAAVSRVYGKLRREGLLIREGAPPKCNYFANPQDDWGKQIVGRLSQRFSELRSGYATDVTHLFQSAKRAVKLSCGFASLVGLFEDTTPMMPRHVCQRPLALSQLDPESFSTILHAPGGELSALNRLNRHLQGLIVSGRLPARHILPSAGNLAQSLGVAFGLIQRSLKNLEARGFISRSGRYGGQSLIINARCRYLAHLHVEILGEVVRLRHFDLHDDDLLDFISRALGTLPSPP